MDEKTAQLLNRMLEFLDYDPDRTVFRLGEVTWSFEVRDTVEFANRFDDTGVLTLVRLAAICREYLQGTSVSVLEVLKDPSVIDRYREMYGLLGSEEVASARKMLLDGLARVASMVSGGRLVGDARDFDASLDDSVTAVTREFRKLKCESYASSGRPVGAVDRFSTSVQVCGSLAECLLKLEKSPDGCYACYVSNPGTLDGWFGFFVKSNGNLFSYNERLDEAYVGQHRNCRNGRYAEDKAYELFPYDQMVEFSKERDYKGYSTAMDIDRDSLSFADLSKSSPSVMTRMLLAMSLIARRHSGRPLDAETARPVMVDSLLPQSLKLLAGAESRALVRLDSSALVRASSSFAVSFDRKKVLDGTYNAEFNHPDGDGEKNYRYDEYGYFSDANREMVDAYGDDFEMPDMDELIASPSARRLIGEGDTPQEFVGSERRMRLLAYYRIRQKLAMHVSRRMREDFDRAGGVSGLVEWFCQHLSPLKDKVYRLCVEAWNSTRKEDGEICRYELGEKVRYTAIHGEAAVGKATEISVREGRDAQNAFYHNGVYCDKLAVFNPRRSGDRCFLCPVTGQKVNVAFRFTFQDWRQVEDFLGEKLPKYCVGWTMYPPYGGNSILDVTDAVGHLKNVLSDDRYYASRFYFTFTVGFSRPGLQKVMKEAAGQDGAV